MYILKKHPILSYFSLAFLISYGGACITILPKLLQGKAIKPLDALLLFPIMVVGVALISITLTYFFEGKEGIKLLFAKITRWQIGWQWYLTLLIPPSLILLILLFFKVFISAKFTPNFFPVGIMFGLVAGVFEEIGWTGFVFPRMQKKTTTLIAGSILGLLWGLWHMPVVDYLGSAAPHGSYWVQFFLVFILLVTALRIIISWIYTNTKSIFLAQLLHISSTSSLVIFSPTTLTPAQETVWYAVYALSLWIIVVLLVKLFGQKLIVKNLLFRTGTTRRYRN